MLPMGEINTKRPQWERKIQKDTSRREKYKMTPMGKKNTKRHQALLPYHECSQ